MSVGTLYVVATPLGHLGDLSPRAADTLRSVAIVAAEDTRRSRTLLSHVDSHAKLVSCHAHSDTGRLARLVDELLAGRSIALVTDAGTPAVSDPGPALVARARAAGVPVVAVPGPSAVATALSISGLSGDRYTFLGFLPRKGRERHRLLAQASASAWPVVMFEAANRLVALLGDLAASAGDDREVIVAREMTKVHEEMRSGSLADLAAHYRAHEPRGEVTVILAGGPEPAPAAPTGAQPRMRARQLLAEGISRKDAAHRLAEEFALSRNDAYRVVTDLDHRPPEEEPHGEDRLA